MFTKPSCGWVGITVGNYKASASYLRDVPMETIGSFIAAIQNNTPASILYDAEGWEFITVFDSYNAYVIECKDLESTIYHYTINFNNVIEDVYNDFNNNFNDWCNWNFNEDEDDVKEYSKELRSKLNELRKVIDTMN